MNINNEEKELIITGLKELKKNVYIQSADQENKVDDLLERMENSDYSLSGLGSENNND